MSRPLRFIQRVGRCGKSAHVTFPRPFLFALGIVPGEEVYFEQVSDGLFLLKRFDPVPIQVPSNLNALSARPDAIAK